MPDGANILERLRAAEAERRAREEGLRLPEALAQFNQTLTGVSGRDFAAERKRIADDTIGAYGREEQARAVLPAPEPMGDEFDRAVFGGLLPEGIDITQIPRSRLEKASTALARQAAERRAQAQLDETSRHNRAVERQRAAAPAGAITPYQQAMLERSAQRDKVILADRQDKAEERRTSLEVPGYGVAHDPVEARDLRNLVGNADYADKVIDKLTALRSAKGGEVLDRTAVREGAQLASDLRVIIKDAAKLGVLSATDYTLLDSLVPADPLEFNPLSALSGGDPTMAQLQQLKTSLRERLQSGLSSRLREGGRVPGRVPTPAPAAPAPTSPQAPSEDPDLAALEAELERRRANTR